MTNSSSHITQKLWNYCSITRDDGLSYGNYVERLTNESVGPATAAPRLRSDCLARRPARLGSAFSNEP